MLYVPEIVRDVYNVEIEVSCTEMWPVIVHDL